jgi:hypothetical protein
MIDCRKILLRPRGKDIKSYPSSSVGKVGFKAETYSE